MNITKLKSAQCKGQETMNNVLNYSPFGRHATPTVDCVAFPSTTTQGPLLTPAPCVAMVTGVAVATGSVAAVTRTAHPGFVNVENYFQVVLDKLFKLLLICNRAILHLKDECPHVIELVPQQYVSLEKVSLISYNDRYWTR